ncbi:restriction endonuclease subunit S [Priestia aryabhattai]|uniref:restriction endonuclease subunit S n=1 Tax=Priestia aryabhattai TaxID=412384 RepID=UPI00210A7573|nr:restriction endonuclease subunit S [Priestia aryabhattai]
MVKIPGLGTVPIDWKVSKIGKELQILNNLRKPINEEERKEMKGIYPYYGPTKIQDYINQYAFEGKYTLIGEDGDHFLKYREKPITLLVEGKFNVNNHAHVLRGGENCLTEWFYYFYKNKSIYQYLTRQGAKRYKLTKESLSQMDIPLPSIEEQRKIVRILATWDKAIELKEKLIELKKLQKKGILEKLLTGKVRLHGFADEWEEVKFKDVFETVTDYVANGSFANLRENVSYKSKEDYAILLRIQDYSNRFKGNFVYIDKKAYDFLKKSTLSEGDIVISNVGAIGTVFKVPNLDKPLSLAPNAILVRSNNYNNEFLYQYLASDLGKNQMLSITSITAQPKFNKTDFKQLVMRLPKKSEQEKIAEILSKCDKEIELLEKEYNQLKIQRKGLMQLLLTGKSRVMA